MNTFMTEGAVQHGLAPIGSSFCVQLRPFRPSVDVTPLSRWATFPRIESISTLELAELLRELILATGWSHRRLASVLRTSHPTIGAIIRGETAAERLPGLGRALEKTADVVARLARLVDNDRSHLNRLLQSTLDNGRTPLDLLADGNYARAYLVAIDLLGRRRQPNIPLGTDRIRQPGNDVAALFDDDE